MLKHSSIDKLRKGDTEFMPQKPGEVWDRQTKKQKELILKELTLICHGVINEHIRINQTLSPSSEGHYLHSTIHASPNINQSGELKIAICA
jgi:hypothetical protein